MQSKYIDNTAIIQVIGNVFNNPGLLEFTDKYSINEEDFPNEFYQIVFGAIYKIHELGANKISLENIADFLADRPKCEAIFKVEKGEEWLRYASLNAMQESFDYYYSRMKKMTLLRAYDSYGVDVTDIYDPDNVLDIKKKELQEELLDNSTLEEIANKVDLKIDEIRSKYIDDSTDDTY